MACWPAQDGVYLTNNATRYALRKNSCVPGSWRDVNGTLKLALPACRLARAMSSASGYRGYRPAMLMCAPKRTIIV